MSNFIWGTETYGANLLIGVGSVVGLFAVIVATYQQLHSKRLSLQLSANTVGVIASCVTLILGGIVVRLVFDEQTGIERVIGTLFVWTTAVLSLGIGMRATHTALSYPECR